MANQGKPFDLKGSALGREIEEVIKRMGETGCTNANVSGEDCAKVWTDFYALMARVAQATLGWHSES